MFLRHNYVVFLCLETFHGYRLIKKHVMSIRPCTLTCTGEVSLYGSQTSEHWRLCISPITSCQFVFDIPRLAFAKNKKTI